MNPYYDPRWLYAQRQAQAQQLRPEDQRLAAFRQPSPTMRAAESLTVDPANAYAQPQQLQQAPDASALEDERMLAYTGRFR